MTPKQLGKKALLLSNRAERLSKKADKWLDGLRDFHKIRDELHSLRAEYEEIKKENTRDSIAIWLIGNVEGWTDEAEKTIYEGMDFMNIHAVDFRGVA